MKNIVPWSLSVIAALALAGCGGAVSAASLVGTWQEVGVEKHGHVLEFDAKSDKFLLHGPGPGGHESHDHFEGTFRIDAGEVVLTGAWESNGKAEVVRGRLAGEILRMLFTPKAIEFRRK